MELLFNIRIRSILLALALAATSHASIGLTGIDSWPNSPFCATACYGCLSSYRLSCSEIHGDPDDHHAHVETSPSCRSDHLSFLSSLAWCISSKCDEVGADLSTADIERFWEGKSTGDPNVAPVWSYRQALANVTEEPTMVLGHGGTINETVVPPEFWNVLYGTYSTLDNEGYNMNVFGLVLLNVGFGLPILLSWLRFIPGVDRLYDNLKPYLVFPSLLARYHVRPLLFSIGNAPTIGQALYIGFMIILNIILTAINYKTTEAHLWFQTNSQQIAGYMMYRTGVLSFAMAPLVFLFSGRNNLLQWLTNWPHSTFMVLHRWIARLFVLQALLHTVLAVGVYAEMGIYEVEAKLPYWAWGVVATLFACIMLVVSTLFFRKLSYEIFLISHIIMAILVIVGSWYHVVLRFSELDGFTMWLWTACAVWFFDRVVRVLRILRVGVRRARVTDIGDGYVRVDVPGVRWGHALGQKVYVYFPSLNPLRPWENHPFSVMPTSLIDPPALALATEVSDQDQEASNITPAQDPEKRPVPITKSSLIGGSDGSAVVSSSSSLSPGITLLIRKSAGMTRSLQAHQGLFTLLEGPYPNTNTSSILQCDRILLFAGGIGITGILPWTASPHPNTRLLWTAKQSAKCLVEALENSLQTVREKTVTLDARTDVEAVLAEEVAAGWARIGVVVCGPGGLCDDARAAVAKAGRLHRGKVVFELEVDAYSW